MSRVTVKAFGTAPAGIATGQCLCGKVQVEISIPAFWRGTTIRGPASERMAPPMPRMSAVGAAVSA